jgi:hypothetical protein
MSMSIRRRASAADTCRAATLCRAVAIRVPSAVIDASGSPFGVGSRASSCWRSPLSWISPTCDRRAVSSTAVSLVISAMSCSTTGRIPEPAGNLSR